MKFVINQRQFALDYQPIVSLDDGRTKGFEALLRGIMARWSIPAGGVIGHSDMAPGRKSDPGQRFDWARLARQGLAGCATGPAPDGPASEEGFRAAATKAGYPADTSLDVLLQATRLRFAPWRTGPLCAADLALHHDLKP